jgi:hypothetical protein
VPSGNTMTFSFFINSVIFFITLICADPRFTGKDPHEDIICLKTGILNNSTFAGAKTFPPGMRANIAAGIMMVSNMETWFDASITPPLLGTFSTPETFKRLANLKYVIITSALKKIQHRLMIKSIFPIKP